ncbi:MAG: glycosyltransferase [bacterium]
MRIAHICTKFNRLSETFIYDLIQGLEQAGTENHVLTTVRVNEGERPFDRVKLLPLSFSQKAAFMIQKHCLGRYRFPLPYRKTCQTLQDIRPNVILAHFGGAGAAIAPAAQELGIPLVVVFHAFDLFMRHVRPTSYTSLWESKHQAVAVSQHGKARLIELGCPAERTRIIHCGVDISRFPPLKCATPRPGTFRLVSIGRLVEKKGFDDLIHAVARLRNVTAQPIRLDIWGDGPRRRHLDTLARRLGVKDRVNFRGVAANGDIPGILREYDAFVLPSRTARNGDKEGIPITILEAQAAGLPVVATRHAGIPEAIPPSNREWLADEGNILDLAEKLRSLSSQPDQWDNIGRRGKAWVVRHFALHEEVSAYLDLFATLPAMSSRKPLGSA